MGGGIHCYECGPTIIRCTVSKNIAEGFGGGICSADAVITECTITENETWEYNGGGIYTPWENNPLISRCTISKNTAARMGGGIFCYSDAIISRCLITENHADGYSTFDYGGGGIYCEDGGTVINACSITKNTAYDNGGGINCHWGDVIVQNCMIMENSADGHGTSHGGGIFCSHVCYPITITNCTLVDNYSLGGGGGFYEYYSPYARITNCILWGNNTPAGDNQISGNADVTYSDVQDGWPGEGNIEEFPFFVETPIDSTDRDFHLYYHSPCRNAGNNSAPGLPAEDFEGDPRIADGKVDMGADEFYTHLYYTGDFSPGEYIEIKIVGTPYSTPVFLWVGSGVLSSPLNTPYGDWYLSFPLVLQLPVIPVPADGVIKLYFDLPPDLPLPEYFPPMQALVEDRLTNLCPMDLYPLDRMSSKNRNNATD